MDKSFKLFLVARLAGVVGAMVGATAVAANTITAAVPDLEVPFIVSPPAVVTTMLEMAKVSANDMLLDLGSGDGRIVILAAKNYHARGLGVEIDPRLVTIARTNAAKANVTDRAQFRVEDLFITDLAAATVITMYLLPDVNLALRPKLLALKPGTRIVSHDWDLGDWLHDVMRVVDNPDKPVGREKTSKIFLWTVPAQIDGKWCAIDIGEPVEPPMIVTLDLIQKYQSLHGVLLAGRPDQKKPMRIQFRSTVHGDQFVIADATTDAVAKVGTDTIIFDGSAYGLSNQLKFKRAHQCTAPDDRPVSRPGSVQPLAGLKTTG